MSLRQRLKGIVQGPDASAVVRCDRLHRDQHGALDALIGTSSAAGKKRFLKSVELFETVDEDLWK